eukprot:353933-Chlamydomonas_euryale.AAC.7
MFSTGSVWASHTAFQFGRRQHSTAQHGAARRSPAIPTPLRGAHIGPRLCDSGTALGELPARCRGFYDERRRRRGAVDGPQMSSPAELAASAAPAAAAPSAAAGGGAAGSPRPRRSSSGAARGPGRVTASRERDFLQRHVRGVGSGNSGGGRGDKTKGQVGIKPAAL